jgi:DNA-directed RNA polymerase subunit RPC12/RpoP
MITDNEVYLEDTLHLPCPSCGSQLEYSADTKSISCAYCGYEEAVDRSKDKVIEQSLAEAASNINSFQPEEQGRKVFNCGNCDARFMVQSEEVKINCAFCGSTNVNLEAYKHQYLQPIGIIPFYISRIEAEKKFEEWLGRGWFHPNKLKRLAAIENLHGIYIPFWTYDAKTESTWRGEAGYYYYVQERLMVRGKVQLKKVRKTRWEQHSGALQHFFDDVLVVASSGLKQQKIQRILPYRLEEIVNYDPRLMLGWEAELYDVEVDRGYQRADVIMDSRIRQMCSAQLGGDTQRNLRVSSRKHSQTFKHIVLPLWICSYTYQNKLYHFLINGQTGRVDGEKPTSWIKIIFLVLLFALFIFAVYLLRQSGILMS